MNKQIDTSVLAPFGRLIQKPQVKWLALAGIVAAMAVTFLNSIQAIPVVDSNSQMDKLNAWDLRTVQIEQLSSDGRWYPRDPLPLSGAWKTQGRGVDRPDFAVALMPMFRTAGEPKSLYLAREVRVECADGKAGLSTVLHDGVTASWEAQLSCISGGTWRMRVVDSNSVLQPPQATQDEILQSQ